MKQYYMKYQAPSDEFYKALPIGNGKLGATVFGQTDYETIVINDESLYSRYPKDENNYGAKNYLRRIRELIFEDHIPEAEEIIDSSKISSCNNSAFLPLANIYLDFGHKNYRNYCRCLYLNNAVHTVEYDCEDVHYKRELFVSAVSKAMTIRITADKEKSVCFALSANSRLYHHCHFPKDGCLRLNGKAPDESYPVHLYNEGKGTPFEMLLQVMPVGGEMKTEFDRIMVKDADEVIIHIVTDTGYINFDALPDKDPHIFCESVMEKVVKTEYNQLLAEHITDYQSWFYRASLDLGKDASDNMFMEERVEKFNSGDAGKGLYELYFQFGRYILISSSRPDSDTPANLQGIWCEDEYAAWAGAYTININLPMNYWLSEVTGLSDLSKPLFDFIKRLSVNGEKTAKAHYDVNGWVCHHNTGIWCKTAPFTDLHGATRWGMWPMAGVWLCSHLWEHYLYTLDREFLKEIAYPIMKGAAVFCREFLCEHNGYLVSCPSTSPENIFYNRHGDICAASYSTTMDICLMREIFENCSKAADILDVDRDFIEELQYTESRLHPIPINKQGILQEWVYDYKEAAPSIGHMSPLYGLYPGNVFSKVKEPELFEAAKKHFLRRYPNFVLNKKGWGAAWRSCIAARLGDGETAANEVSNVFRYNPYPMFISFVENMREKPDDSRGRPICQIDAVMGTTAGIAEMLLQSQDGIIEILPAIPEGWSEGCYEGLKARGCVTVSAKWTNGYVRAELISKLEQEVMVAVGKSAPKLIRLQANIPTVIEGEMYERDVKSYENL